MASAKVWASGDAYEPYDGRWIPLVAHESLVWLNQPPDLRWLDVGSVTGALSQGILATASPRQVVGVDQSRDYVAFARERVAHPLVRFRVADAQALPFPAPEFDVGVSGLVLNFIPAQARALAEMRRAVRPGGTVAIYVWDYAGEMQLMRHFWEAAVTPQSQCSGSRRGAAVPVMQAGAAGRALPASGFSRHRRARAIDVPTVFRDFDDYWSPFLGGQAPAPAYCMSLSEGVRATLREHLRTVCRCVLTGPST